MGQLLICLQSWRKNLPGWGLAIALVILGFLSFPTPALATGVYEIPALQSDQPTWVIDQGDVLSFATQGTLAKRLSNLAQATGNEVRFVTIRRLDYGETAETFTNKLFDKWFPSAAAQANQILVFLDTKTNTAGIRTGEQVQALLPEEIASSIAQETMLVPIRAGNYNQGLLDASDRLMAVLSGQPDPGPPEVKKADFASTFTEAEETNDRSATLIVVGLLIAATVIPMVTYFIYQGQ